MGRLSGFTYREIKKKLISFGFRCVREGKGSHEIWKNHNTQLFTTLPKHTGDMPEGTLRAILKQANISPDDFLR